MNIRETAPRISELEKISTRTDTRDYLAKAAASQRSSRTGWSSMWTPTSTKRRSGRRSPSASTTTCCATSRRRSATAPARRPACININGPLFQDVAGRIMHQQELAEPTPPGLHRQVQLSQRAMDAMGIDYMVVFPTPMLSLGMHPQADAEVRSATPTIAG